MGKSFTSIPFFDTALTIVPHTCSKREHLNRPLSVQEFSSGKPMRLSQNDDNKEFLFELTDGTFAEGPLYKGEKE